MPTKPQRAKGTRGQLAGAGPGRGKKTSGTKTVPPVSDNPTLADLGITKKQSSIRGAGALVAQGSRLTGRGTVGWFASGVLQSPALLVVLDQFLARLNAWKTSQLVRTYAHRYATTQELCDKDGVWQRPDLKPIWDEMSQVTLASLLPGIPHPTIPAEAFQRAQDWVALTHMYGSHIRLSICPEPGCDRFFADVKRRGKSACSPKHAGRLRAKIYYKKLTSNQKKYDAYLEKQAALMRARRKAGLA